jgi:hypothetical protein
MRVRIARDELRRIRELTQTINALETEIANLVAQIAPHLLSEPGFGALTQPSSSARSPAPDASPPTPSSPAPPASPRFPSAPATPTATASTAAATARSTRRFTASPLPASAATPKRRTTSPASEPRARAPKKPAAVSNATSPAASGTSCNRPRPSRTRRSHPQSLDIGAAKAAAGLALSATCAVTGARLEHGATWRPAGPSTWGTEVRGRSRASPVTGHDSRLD